MDLVPILSFMAMATLLVVSPGPNGVLIAKTVPTSGAPAGFANIAGFVVAFYVHGCLSIFGVSVLLVQSSQAFFIFKLLGAIYLCWIGLKALLSAWQTKPLMNPSTLNKKSVSLSSAFFEGLLTNALNPKVSMFYLAALPQFVPTGGESSSTFILVFLHSIINLVWFSAIVILLSRVKRLVYSPVLSRWFKSATGLVFIGFGLKLAFLKPLNH